MARLIEDVDLYVGPATTWSITNLTGHPTAVFPDGFRDSNGRDGPGSITLTGRLYGESTLLAVAHAYQQADRASSQSGRPWSSSWQKTRPTRRKVRRPEDRSRRRSTAGGTWFAAFIHRNRV